MAMVIVGYTCVQSFVTIYPTNVFYKLKYKLFYLRRCLQTCTFVYKFMVSVYMKLCNSYSVHPRAVRLVLPEPEGEGNTSHTARGARAITILKPTAAKCLIWQKEAQGAS